MLIFVEHPVFQIYINTSNGLGKGLPAICGLIFHNLLVVFSYMIGYVRLRFVTLKYRISAIELFQKYDGILSRSFTTEEDEFVWLLRKLL